jgi:hypothetical protein
VGSALLRLLLKGPRLKACSISISFNVQFFIQPSIRLSSASLVTKVCRYWMCSTSTLEASLVFEVVRFSVSQLCICISTLLRQSDGCTSKKPAIAGLVVVQPWERPDGRLSDVHKQA